MIKLEMKPQNDGSSIVRASATINGNEYVAIVENKPWFDKATGKMVELSADQIAEKLRADLFEILRLHIVKTEATDVGAYVAPLDGGAQL